MLPMTTRRAEWLVVQLHLLEMAGVLHLSEAEWQRVLAELEKRVAAHAVKR